MNEDEAKMLDIFDAESGKGFETMSQQDYQPPFLIILQPLSPQLDPSHELYDPTARAGMIYNTQSRRLHEKVHVIVAKYEFRNVEWTPRESGGGFVASHNRTETLGETQTNPLTGRTSLKATGNLVVPTAYYLVLIEEENWDKCILPMYSTQLKKSRRLNSLMTGVKVRKTGDDGKPKEITVPMYGRKYCLSVTAESNNKGKWFGWKFDNGENLTLVEDFNRGKSASQVQAFLPERLVQGLPTPDDEQEVM